MENKLKELDKLEAYLKEHGYHYVREDLTENIERHQITVYKATGKHKYDWDAICQPFSYGYDEGLLEIMGRLVSSKQEQVEGWLTADQIIERLEHGVD